MIDATGKYVIPGGIDAHTHFELPFGGTEASDTFETGTRAAAWGGTTTVIDFAVQTAGTKVQDGLAKWHEKAAGNCAIDYGFHQIIGGVDEDSLKAMEGFVDEGITSYKMFMAYPGVFYSDDGQIVRAMQKAADLGLLTMMHAENGPAIDVLAAQLVAAGQDRPVLPRHRPRLADGGGGHAPRDHARATSPARRSTSCTSARSRPSSSSPGRATRARTCSARPARSTSTSRSRSSSARSSEEWGDFEGAKWVCSTPLRSREEGHQDHMWQALRTNDLQMVSTDHCPFCMKGQKELGKDEFRKIPNGIGSVEHRMDLLYQGVVTGELTLERWVELTSTTPARMFGMYGKKGVIAPGADADVVVYDPKGHTTISKETHHMNMDYSAWEGFEIDGHVDTVLSRGKVVIDDGEYLGAKGDGKFIKRGLTQYLI